MCSPAGPTLWVWPERGGSVRLRRKTGRNLLLTAVLLAMCAGMVCLPNLVLLIGIKRADPQAEILWCGSLPIEEENGRAWVTGKPVAFAWSGGQLLFGSMGRYEGRAYFTGPDRMEWPEEGQVLALLCSGYNGSGETLGCLMIAALPPETAKGAVTVKLSEGDIRSAQGEKKGDVMFFWIGGGTASREELRGQWRQLICSDYSVTLWDENGGVLLASQGTVSGI